MNFSDAVTEAIEQIKADPRAVQQAMDLASASASGLATAMTKAWSRDPQTEALERLLSLRIYIPEGTVTCNEEACPCDGEPVAPARRVTIRQLAEAAQAHLDAMGQMGQSEGPSCENVASVPASNHRKDAQ